MECIFSVGQLVAFRMLASRVSGPVLRLVQLWQEYQQAALSVKRIGDIFNSPTEPVPKTTITSQIKIKGDISFDKVHFRYNIESSEVIKGMSFDIKANSIIGIVGRSGSGKSTVSKLIQRLYIPEGGKITVDKMDISMMDPEVLRSQIGVVLQENFMFNGSVRENISIRVPNATTEQVVNAAKIEEQHRTYVEPASALTGMANKKLTIRIYPITKEDTGLVVMMNKDADSSFKFDNKTIKGTLCFSVTE